MPWRETPAELERARAERPELVASPHGRLFGVFTPPDPAVPPAGVCAVLFTSPRGHRNRMWVEAARRLAAEGFAAFRVDFHGTGDSEGETAFRDPGRPYREDAVAVLRHLRASHGHTRFVLYGICFDARTALSACMDEADAIAGILFVSAPLMELEGQVQAHAERKGWGHLARRALWNPDNWRTLTRPARWRHMGLVLGRLLRRSAAPAGAPELPLSPSFLEHLAAFSRSRARILFLYGREDAEYETFRVAERQLFPRLDPRVRERIEIEAWPGRVHGFLDVPRQREVLERCLAWIGGFRAGAAGDRSGPAR